MQLLKVRLLLEHILQELAEIGRGEEHLLAAEEPRLARLLRTLDQKCHESAAALEGACEALARAEPSEAELALAGMAALGAEPFAERLRLTLGCEARLTSDE